MNAGSRNVGAVINLPQRTSTTRAVRAVVAAVLAAGTFGSRTTAAHATDGQVPFFGLYFGDATFTSDTTIAFDGTGIATHLGGSVNHGDITLTGPDSSCPGGLANTHVDTFTAANGDSLTITADDVACPTGPMQFRGTGTWVVTGGTGRFSDATGSGTITGGANFITQTFTFEMSGTITAPRA